MKQSRLNALGTLWRRWRLLGPAVLVMLVGATPLWPRQQTPAVRADAALSSLIYLPLVFKNYNADCRFGITVPNGLEGYDLAHLGAGAYLNWSMSISPTRPSAMAYIQEVRLGGTNYTATVAQIPAVAHAQPGSYWAVGNEPDTTYGLVSGGEQDNIPPATYAARYYEVYTQIKTADPSARVGIGGIVQPTAVRMEYLDRMLAAYQSAHGSLPPSDFWHIHAFVLNEVPGEWGTGMPIDHATHPYASAPEVIQPEENDSLTILDRRLTAFRQWMARNGQRGKPLWITEYGVLMPSEVGSVPYFTISMDRTRNFMLGSFTYFQTRADAATGLASDNNRLVQRWFWWALSTDLRQTGGGLYDEGAAGKPKTVLYDAYYSASNCR